MNGDLGIVVIGRNEGERLRRCLESVCRSGMPVVYVDSASTDGSCTVAQSLGAMVVRLDDGLPLNAARARNEGFDHLLRAVPQTKFVQFVDGDCEIAPGWLAAGVEALRADESLGIVCGRLVERDPRASVYHMLAAIEWDKQPGPLRACGGIFMARTEAFRKAGGFSSAVLAAEDDDLCIRVRRAGWRIVMLDCQMGVHDLGPMSFRRWWKRAFRAGHGYAQGMSLHGAGPERHFVRQTRSACFWGLMLPLLAAGLAWPTHGWSFVLLLGYPALALRIWFRTWRRGAGMRESIWYAVFCVLAKFPQAFGALRFWWERFRRRPARLIEYK